MIARFDATRLRVALSLALLAASVGGVAGCRAPAGGDDGAREDAGDAERTGDSLASTGDDPNAPRTDDCRSFEGLDVEALDPLPESPYRRNFEKVWRTVLERHYDPTLGCLDWPAMRERYGARVAAAKSEAEAFAVMNEMLDTLGQSHLRVVAPYRRTDGATAEDETGPARVPVAVMVLDDGHAYVADRSLDGHEAPIPTGARLLQVGSAKVADAMARGRHNGRRATEKRLYARRAVDALLRCPEGGTKPVTFEVADGDAPTTVEAPCYLPKGERVSLGNLRDLPTQVTWRMLDAEGVGYLAFNYWMVPMVAEVRRGMKELRAAGMKSLVLDLRGNPGGVGAMSIPVARMLLSTPGDLGRLRMRGMTNEFKVQPDPDAFTGPVVVLVDEGTASTSEIFTVGLRDMGRIRVVGASSSAGLALPSLMETLPDGGIIQYVVGDYHSPEGTVAEGAGVKLDVKVDVRRSDLAEGRDPVLEAGVAALSSVVAPRPDDG